MADRIEPSSSAAEVFNGLDRVPEALQGCVLTIGNFDGVHRGHQEILARAGNFAARLNRQVAVLTFDPHPLDIIAPARAPAKLMPLEEKVRCLAKAGADTVVVARSDTFLLSMEPLAFVERIVVDKFKPVHIVEGWSFRFGKGRQGTPQLLQDLGARFGFAVFVAEPVSVEVAPGEDAQVSSSLVRRLISEGHVQRAERCLGRPYELLGRIEKGQARGAKLGYPTANLGEIEQLIPAQGVYAGTAEIRGAAWPAAISVGTTPTFDGQGVQVEAFLLDCDEQLHGQAMRLAFRRWIRPQRKFDSAEELVRQIEADVQQVRKLAAETERSESGA